MDYSPTTPATLLDEAFRAMIRQEVEAALVSFRNGNGHHAPAELLDVGGLAVALKVDKSWIYERTRRKVNPIPHYKVGRYPRFDLVEVKAWLKNT